jgi:hypothetical protein
MKKSLTVLCLVCLGFVSCGKVSRTVAAVTGYSIECVKGVEYIQFTSGVSVAYTPDGRIKTCNE